MKKLEQLAPSDSTVKLSVKSEELSIKKVKNLLTRSKIDPKSISILLKVMNTIAKMRINQRAEASIKVKIFRDIAENKKELKMYVESSFPQITNIKKK